jgi:hypothetical protein
MSRMVSMWRSGTANTLKPLPSLGVPGTRAQAGPSRITILVTIKFLATNVSFLFRRLLSVFLQLL